MKDFHPRLIPIWVWIAAIIIIVILSSSCRGGRSLGKGSAGTVITPQTPQEINERNRPVFEPLPPIPIVPPQSNPISTTNAVRSTPGPPKHAPIKANPIIVDPKPVGELTPFKPTVSTNLLTKLPPVKTEKLPPKIVEGGCVIITPPTKNPQTDNKATSPEIAGPCEATPPAKADSFDWIELILNYLVVILFAILIWVIYDIIKRRGSSTVNRLSNTKLKKAPSKKKTTKKKATKKKTTSKKKLEEYKKTIPKGLFFDGKSKKPKN